MASLRSARAPSGSNDERMAPRRPSAVPGHWEGDLVFGKNMSPVATLAGRPARFVMLVALPSGNHQADLDAIAQDLNERPRQTLGFKTSSQALAEVLH